MNIAAEIEMSIRANAGLISEKLEGDLIKQEESIEENTETLESEKSSKKKD